MINEYVAIAGRGMKELQVEVIKMCLSGIKQYQKCMEEGIVQFEDPADECCCYYHNNDCDEIADNLIKISRINTKTYWRNLTLKERWMLFAFNAKAYHDFLPVQSECNFFKICEIEDKLFDTESWKSQENLDACLCTIDDYLSDFGDRLVDMSCDFGRSVF